MAIDKTIKQELYDRVMGQIVASHIIVGLMMSREPKSEEDKKKMGDDVLDEMRKASQKIVDQVLAAVSADQGVTDAQKRDQAA